MNIPTHMDLVWMQCLNGATEVMEHEIPIERALARLQEVSREDHGAGCIVFLRPSRDVLAAVATELERARAHHGPMVNAHEAYAVILEELDEFKAHVWTKQSKRDLAAMRIELIQLAAMAVRAVEDLEL